MQMHFYPSLIIPRDGVHSSVNMSRPLRGKAHLPLIWDQCHMVDVLLRIAARGQQAKLRRER